MKYFDEYQEQREFFLHEDQSVRIDENHGLVENSSSRLQLLQISRYEVITHVGIVSPQTPPKYTYSEI